MDYLYIWSSPLAVAASPSTCAKHCRAVGDTPIGTASFSPNTFTVVSMLHR